MADMANSLDESAQNDITKNPLGTLKEKSHEYGGELMKCLAKTVQDLAGPAGPLQMLTSTVRNLQNDMQDMKRKNVDEMEESGKKAKMDSSAGAMVTVPPSESTVGGNDADEPSGSEVDIEDLMAVPSEETVESDNQDIFDDLDQYFEVQTEIGTKVSDKLAALIDRALHEDPKEEKLKNTVSKYKRPENVHNLQIPKVDQILWRVLDRATRSVDVQLQKSMNNMAKCLGPTTKMLEIFLNPSDTKEDMKQLRELAMDSFKIMAHCFAANIHERKERIKKETHLKPRVKSILAEAKTSPTLLFGDKLKDEMKVLSEKSYTLTVESQFSRPRSSPSFLYRRGVRTTSTHRASHTSTPRASHTRPTKDSTTTTATRNVRI